MKLELNQVSKVIHSQKIIENVSITMEGGHVYGLCGYNGCGKTMLMRLITGLIRPTSGTISIDGNLLGKDMDFPYDTGLMIENPAFLGGYSGYKNLYLLSKIQNKIKPEDIKSALKRVGLENVGTKKYRKYSLGMKQRLGIAAAIMEKPVMIVLDEPTNALDSEGVERVKQIIKEESERGALVIMTCHDKSILDNLCDIIYTIECGRIIDQEVKTH